MTPTTGLTTIGDLLVAAQRILAAHHAAQRLETLDLAVDAHDVRVPFAGQLEGRDRTAVLAHLGADHAEAGIGAEVARLALYRLADVGQRGLEVAHQPVRRR